jgi:hypothetical protein
MSTIPSSIDIGGPGTHLFVPASFAAMETANMLQKVVYTDGEGGYTYTCCAFPGSGAVSDDVWMIRRKDASGNVMFPVVDGHIVATPTLAATNITVVSGYTYGYSA